MLEVEGPEDVRAELARIGTELVDRYGGPAGDALCRAALPSRDGSARHHRGTSTPTGPLTEVVDVVA